MNILKRLQSMFPHTVVHEPFVSGDAYGDETYGTAVNRKARVKGQHKVVRTASGELRDSNITIIFAEYFACSALDRFTLPSNFVPNQPMALQVEEIPDENGMHHVKVYF